MAKKDPLQWMPVNVTDWKLSKAVRKMPAAARSGYFELLLTQWIEDGLSSDRDEIEMDSRLSKKEWRRYGDLILSMFELCEDGKYRNKRCSEERINAVNRLETFRARTKAATDARKKQRNDNVTYNVTKTVTCVQDRTVQDSTRHNSNTNPPLPPTPVGTVTVFDQEAEIAQRLDAYKPGPGETDPDEEDYSNALKAIEQVTAGLRPGAKAIFLRELAQFPPLQVCMAGDEWLKMEHPPRGDPKPFFMGIVRRSAATRYLKYTGKLEQKADERLQKTRRTEGEQVGSVRPNRIHNGGPTPIGDTVLRTLPKVRRACENAGQPPPKKADDVLPSG